MSAPVTMGRAGHLGGQPVGREQRVQLEPTQIVVEYVGSPALVRQTHPHNLVPDRRHVTR